LLQHPNDLLFTKAASFHGASPLVVLYPEKPSFGWTKFRGAGQFGDNQRFNSVLHFLECLLPLFIASTVW
ncbi:MAG: hypothetical protein ACRD4C_07140, partial [Candidatus Acidiferrales bacterium]